MQIPISSLSLIPSERIKISNPKYRREKWLELSRFYPRNMATWFLLLFSTVSSTSGWLSRYKVPYPTLYASESENKDAKLFNCVQRGHQNSLEYMPMVLILLILGGMKHPCVSAGLGLFYTITRYFYFTGYASGVPEKRLTIGRFGFFAIMGLMICSIKFGVSLLMA